MTVPAVVLSRDGGTHAHLWPSRDQRLLLTAVFGPATEAIAAFQQWKLNVDLDSDFGWESVRLLPLVYHRLHSLGVDDALMGRMKGMYRRAWSENHRLFHETAPVIAQLVHHGVDVLLLKGAPLAHSYYGNPALRPMSDLDIAVRRESLHRALALMHDIGWRCTTDPNERRLRFVHALQFVGPERGEIDLHFRVLVEANRKGADDAFWSRTEPLAVDGMQVLQLEPAFMLLHVVIHGLRWNVETPIRWISDALTIVRMRAADIDWEAMVSFAQRQRITHRLGLGLAYLVDEFDAAIPGDVITRLRSSGPTLLERAENTVLFTDVRAFGGVLPNHWLNLVEFARSPSAATPLGFVRGYPHFLAYRFNLNGRRELLSFLARGMVRMLTGSRDTIETVKG
ncbi:MAG: hypothetical protein JWM95_3376 [Gemmatimonadetes bacterium]|nr:hypothetical protein [Gemmatimonadota bacterium]